jgi:hypothetical protein
MNEEDLHELAVRTEDVFLSSLGENVDHVEGETAHTACGLTKVQFGRIARRQNHTIKRKLFPTCGTCAEVVTATFDAKLKQRCKELGVPLTPLLAHFKAPNYGSSFCGLTVEELGRLARSFAHSMHFYTEPRTTVFEQVCPACADKAKIQDVKETLKAVE